MKEGTENELPNLHFWLRHCIFTITLANESSFLRVEWRATDVFCRRK